MAEDKTHLKKLLNPNFLGDWSLPGGKDVVLTIKGFGKGEGWSEKDQKKIPLPIILFEETYDWVRPFVPNATNVEMLSKVTGSKYQEDVVGCKIQIGLLHGKWFGKEQDALRIRNVKSSKLLEDYTTFLIAIPLCKTKAELTDLMNTYAIFKPFSAEVQKQIRDSWQTLT